jgi:hypothetical protein
MQITFGLHVRTWQVLPAVVRQRSPQALCAMGDPLEVFCSMYLSY